MAEILQDTSKRVVTLCSCRSYAPNAREIREAQKNCALYQTRRGGWCLFYVGRGSENDTGMCTWLESRNGKKDNPTSSIYI